jgi:rRNA processing protein Gar1
MRRYARVIVPLVGIAFLSTCQESSPTGLSPHTLSAVRAGTPSRFDVEYGLSRVTDHEYQILQLKSKIESLDDRIGKIEKCIGEHDGVYTSITGSRKCISERIRQLESDVVGLKNELLVQDIKKQTESQSRVHTAAMELAGYFAANPDLLRSIIANPAIHGGALPRGQQGAEDTDEGGSRAGDGDGPGG